MGPVVYVIAQRTMTSNMVPEGLPAAQRSRFLLFVRRPEGSLGGQRLHPSRR